MDELRSDGRVRRAQLGVSVQPVTSDMAESLGLKEVGGAIVSWRRARQRGGTRRRQARRRHQVVQRPGRCRTSTRCATASPRPRPDRRDGRRRSRRQRARADGEARRSCGVEEARERDGGADERRQGGARRLGGAADAGTGGARRPRARREGSARAGVDPDGRAADAGIQAGDVIQEVNRQPVQSVDELRAAVKSAPGPAGSAAGQPRGQGPLRDRQTFIVAASAGALGIGIA